MRRDRFPTLTVHADPRTGLPSQLFNRVRSKIEQIELPPGYSLEWGGEYEDSRDARAALAKPLPYALALMVFIVVCLFNSIRTTLLVWLIVPLAIIGVTVGLLLTGQPFGFMALLGVLSLGRRADQELDRRAEQNSARDRRGKAAISGDSRRLRQQDAAGADGGPHHRPRHRFRCLNDPFFGAMAVCIMFGLSFACVLTLLVMPALYAIFYSVHEPGSGRQGVNPVARNQDRLGAATIARDVGRDFRSRLAVAGRLRRVVQAARGLAAGTGGGLRADDRALTGRPRRGEQSRHSRFSLVAAGIPVRVAVCRDGRRFVIDPARWHHGAGRAQ